MDFTQSAWVRRTAAVMSTLDGVKPVEIVACSSVLVCPDSDGTALFQNLYEKTLSMIGDSSQLNTSSGYHTRSDITRAESRLEIGFKRFEKFTLTRHQMIHERLRVKNRH